MDNNLKNKKITIIGLGLIGGSLARVLQERAGPLDITAVNRGKTSLLQALEDRIVSKGLTELDDSVYDSDIIFICTPVKKTIEYLNALSTKVHPNCLITDVGSTKAEIIEYVNSMENAPGFIGGHPMAGSEKTGYSVSFSHLFENAYYILSPCKTTNDNHIELMTELVKVIGGIPVVLDASEHDRITGSISHVPHIIASALVNLVKNTDSNEKKMQMLAAGGFKDITRIASSSPEMWESIVSSNRHQIDAILDAYIEILQGFRHSMQDIDNEGIFNFLKSAKDFRDSFITSGSAAKPSVGLITPAYDIIVDVVDKPGIIGEIATILGNNDINIKNINVSNSREYEQGCLIITLSDSESVNTAFDLLCSKGYKVYKSS